MTCRPQDYPSTISKDTIILHSFSCKPEELNTVLLHEWIQTFFLKFVHTTNQKIKSTLFEIWASEGRSMKTNPGRVKQIAITQCKQLFSFLFFFPPRPPFCGQERLTLRFWGGKIKSDNVSLSDNVTDFLAYSKCEPLFSAVVSASNNPPVSPIASLMI